MKLNRLSAFAALAILLAQPAFAQIAYETTDSQGNKISVNVSAENPLPVTGGGGGGGGGGGDASASNQVILNNRIGDVTTPGTGSVNFRLEQIRSAIANPFQAGGSIGNTSFGATQSGAWNVGLTGAIPTGSNTIGAISNTSFGITGPVAVTGTFWQATQPVSGTFWQATQPVSAASLPLPSGAATAARQDLAQASLDILAGGVSSNIFQVNCVTGCGGGGGGSGGYTVVNGSTYANTGSYQNNPVGGLVSTSAPTYTTGQASPFSLTTAGELRINGAGYTQPVSGTFWQATQPVSALSLPLPSGAATDASLGNLTETAPATDTGSSAINGRLQRIAQRLTTLITATGSPMQNSGGTVGISGTLPAFASTPTVNLGTLNGAATAANQSTEISSLSTIATNTTNAGAPSVAQDTAGNVKIIQASASAAISMSTATTTQIVALSSAKKIYVVAYDVIAGGTGNVTFVYGTGTNCGTGTTALTGAYPLVANAGLTKGGGLGPVLVVPASNALCVTSSAAVQMSGSVAYAQF